MRARLLGLGLALGLAAGATAAQEVKLDAATKAKIRKLQLERRDALKKTLLGRLQHYSFAPPEPVRGIPPVTLDELLRVSRKLLKAELAAAMKPEERVAAHAFHLEMMKGAQRRTQHLATSGGFASKTDIESVRAARLKAEIQWLKAGGKDSGKEMKRGRDSKVDSDLARAISMAFAAPDRSSKDKKPKE